jgi:hypothetical protein
MNVRIRIRFPNGAISTMNAFIDGIDKNTDRDKVDDIVSDWLDENCLGYKWYRIMHESEE